jgi:hypothetical protein
VPPLALSNETQTRTVLLMPATYITGCWGCQAKEQQKKKQCSYLDPAHSGIAEGHQTLD